MSFVGWLSLFVCLFCFVLFCFGFFIYLFIFFFKVALVDVGLCQWWLSMLLQQWILVAGGYAVDIVAVVDNNGEEIIYYFNV